jgi:glycosyltransferase involved in cell wall biosynthesis
MRIIFITQWFDPEPGVIRGLPLARWMKQRGHDVSVITGFPNYPGGKVYPGYRIHLWQREQMDGVDVLRVPLYPSHGTSAAGRILNYLSFAFSAATIGVALTKKADVAFVYHPPPTVGIPSLVLKWLRRTPYVYHIADMWPEAMTESGMLGKGLLRKIAFAVVSAYCNFLYRRAHSVTSQSPGFKNQLVGRGTPAEKIHVVYNWTADDVFKPMDADPNLLREFGMEGRFNIVYAGNLGAFQGLETVIRAAKLLEHEPKIQFVLVGTGQKEPELKALAESLQTTNVKFIGARPYADMPRVNALADVLIVHTVDLPHFVGNIPSKTQVSLASGKPVLMAVRGDSADIVNNAKAGVVCEPENPEAMAKATLELFRKSREELDEMGRRGREFYVSEMAMEIGALRTEEILAEACAHRK